MDIILRFIGVIGRLFIQKWLGLIQLELIYHQVCPFCHTNHHFRSLVYAHEKLLVAPIRECHLNEVTLQVC